MTRARDRAATTAAHLQGYAGGTAWFGDEAQPSAAKRILGILGILGIPADRTARSLVAIGRPTSLKDPRPAPRDRWAQAALGDGQLRALGRSLS